MRGMKSGDSCGLSVCVSGLAMEFSMWIESVCVCVCVCV